MAPKRSITGDVHFSPEKNSSITIGGEIGGIGGSITFSADGNNSVSAGIGIMEIDYNSDGSGRVGYLGNLYEMEVTRDGCNFVKDFYISGMYAYTEVERDPKCDDYPERDDDGAEDIYNDKESKEEEEFRDEILDLPPIYPDPERLPASEIVLISMSWRFSYISEEGNLLEWAYARGSIALEPSDFPGGVLVQTSRYTAHVNQSWRAEIEGTRWQAINPDNSFDSFSTSDFSDTYRGPWQIQNSFNTFFGIAYYGDGRAFLPCFFFGRYGRFMELLPSLYMNVSYVTVLPGGESIHAYRGYSKKLIGLSILNSQPRPLTPPPPNNNNMDCCDTLDRRLKRIERVLSTKKLIDDGGVEIPKQLFIPGGSGEAKIEDYLDLSGTMIRIQAQSGVFPFSIEKKDTNLARAGNQSQTYYLPTATEAVKAILENTIDNETKNDAILNLSVRIGIMVSKIVGKITFIEKTLQAISDFLGYPRREKIVRERIEVDPTLGARKQVGFRGFGPAPRNTNRKIEKQIELIRKKLEEGDKSLESALEDFLQPDDVAVRYEDFDDESGAPDLMELIDKGR